MLSGTIAVKFLLFEKQLDLKMSDKTAWRPNIPNFQLQVLVWRTRFGLPVPASGSIWWHSAMSLPSHLNDTPLTTQYNNDCCFCIFPTLSMNLACVSSC